MEHEIRDQFRTSSGLPNILVGRDTEIIQLVYTQIVNQQTVLNRNLRK